MSAYPSSVSIRVAALVFVVAFTGAACGGGGGSSTTSDPSSVPTSPIEARIGITNFAFTPEDLVVEQGTTVEWQNRAEGIRHTTTASDGEWDSGAIAVGGSFTFTFEQVGTYVYFCSIHPTMTGTITVDGS